MAQHILGTIVIRLFTQDEIKLNFMLFMELITIN